MNKALLHDMDLIPQGGEAIINIFHLEDPPQEPKQKPVPYKQVKFTHKLDEYPNIEVVSRSTRGIITIPKPPKLKTLAIARGNIRVMGFSLVSSGSHSEIWVDANRVATVRKADDKIHIFGPDSLPVISRYMCEISRRGISLAQATDIVCNALCK